MGCCRPRYICFSPYSRVRSLSSTNLRTHAWVGGWVGGSRQQHVCGHGSSECQVGDRVTGAQASCRMRRIERTKKRRRAAAAATHQSLCRSSQLFFRRSAACQDRPAPKQVERECEHGQTDLPPLTRRRSPPPHRRRLHARPHPIPGAPVDGGLASSLGGSTISSSRPRRLVEVVKAAPERCSRVGSDCCKHRTNMPGCCCAVLLCAGAVQGGEGHGPSRRGDDGGRVALGVDR